MKVSDLKKLLNGLDDELEIGLLMLDHKGEPDFFPDIGLLKCHDQELLGLDKKDNFIFGDAPYVVMSCQDVLPAHSEKT